MIKRNQINVAVGSGGTGSSNTGVAINGVIRAVHLALSASFDSSQVITIVDTGVSPTTTILTLTNVTTSGWYYPSVPLHDGTGTPIENAYGPLYISAVVSASITGGTNGQSFVVTILWDDGKETPLFP